MASFRWRITNRTRRDTGILVLLLLPLSRSSFPYFHSFRSCITFAFFRKCVLILLMTSGVNVTSLKFMLFGVFRFCLPTRILTMYLFRLRSFAVVTCASVGTSCRISSIFAIILRLPSIKKVFRMRMSEIDSNTYLCLRSLFSSLSEKSSSSSNSYRFGLLACFSLGYLFFFSRFLLGLILLSVPLYMSGFEIMEMLVSSKSVLVGFFLFSL